MQQKVNSLAQLLFHKVRKEGREEGEEGGKGREGGRGGRRGREGRRRGGREGGGGRGEGGRRGVGGFPLYIWGFSLFSVCMGFPQSIWDSPSVYLLC